MLIKSLSLRGFRNFNTLQLSFEKGINCFYGENAQGKTSLLEALSVLSSGKSFRSHHLKELINSQYDHFFLDLRFEKEKTQHELKFYFDGKEKRIEYNGEHYPNFYPLLGIFPLVIFSPEDIDLLHLGPQYRRRFIDYLIAQSDSLYLFHLTRYHKAMKQRNSLLKMKSFFSMESWEKLMATSASYLIQKRQQFLEKLDKSAQSWFQKLSSESSALELTYQMSSQLKNAPSYESVLESLYKETREKEAQLGQTLHGPHRDDVEMKLFGKPADAFASEGQKRMILLSLKFANWSLLREALHLPPILAFDDFGMHLDDKRKKWALETTQQFDQVLITCPNPIAGGDNTTYFFVQEGCIQKPSLSRGA